MTIFGGILTTADIPVTQQEQGELTHLVGTFAARPAAATANSGSLYLATDVNGGTMYRSNGTAWVQVGASVTMSAGDIVNVAAGDIAATDVQAAINELDTEKVPLAGGTMTGALTLSGAPTANLHAATKQYVDTAVTGLLDYKGGYDASSTSLDGGGAAAVLTGDTYFVTVAGTLNGVAVEVGDMIVANTDAPSNAAGWDIVQSNISDASAFLPLAGGTMTGDLVLANDPSANLHPVTLQYLTAANTPFTATGNIAATDVQAALAELDSEKQAAITADTGWSVANPSTTKSIDVASTTLNTVVATLGTLIDTLKAQGILAA